MKTYPTEVTVLYFAGLNFYQVMWNCLKILWNMFWELFIMFWCCWHTKSKNNKWANHPNLSKNHKTSSILFIKSLQIAQSPTLLDIKMNHFIGRSLSWNPIFPLCSYTHLQIKPIFLHRRHWLWILCQLVLMAMTCKRFQSGIYLSPSPT